MAVRPLKCYGICGSKYFKNELVKVGSLNYCHKCAEIKIKEQQDRNALYTTIQKVYQIPYPNGQMLRQMKEFGEMRNYTYEGITKTICYCVKILKMQLSIRGALSFVPYHYDTAIKYYADLEEKIKNTKEIKDEKIRIEIAPIKHDNKKIIEKVFINLEGLT